jgi:DegV family protein with EDD domain
MERMSNVALITDSTAYIPQDLVDKYNIHVIPQVLIWGEETYRDGIDIQPEEFYNRLGKAKVMPSTSQALPTSFTNLFNELLEKDQEVLAILISEKLSGTIASAIQAKNMLPPDAPVELIDSKTTSMAMGFLVLEAARAAAQGAGLKEIKDFVEKNLDKTGILVTLETLEFLHRGGRIGGGARFLGAALNIKPILELVDGKLEACERVRTRGRALNRVIELVEERIGGRKPVHLASLHAKSPEDAQFMQEKLNERLEVKENVISTVSPVVGTHVGPGTVGIAFLAGV